MNEVEKKIKEISEKWKHKIQEQDVDELTDKFYRQNKVELYKDLEEFWHLYNLEENKVGTWLLVMNDEVMSLVPMYKCSLCGNNFSAYYPPDVCEHCGAKMVVED